jgi:hypothetical protein
MEQHNDRTTHPGHNTKGKTQNMKRNIKSTLLLKSRQGNHRNSSAPIKRYTDRCERHEARHQLATGGWEEDDRNLGEVPEMAFSPDIIGEPMPQNPGGFGFSLSALIGGAK